VRARTARQIVDESLLNAYARAHGLTVSPRTVDARVAVYRLQGGTGFAASLAHLGVSATEFRRLVERNLNAQAVTGRVVNAIATPPVQVQVIQIVVPSRQQAQQLHDEITRGADPMLLAAQYSSDSYIRRLAGQLPPLTRARGDALFGPNWDKVAFAVPPGHVGDPVQLNDGWTVIQVVEREPAASVMERTLSHFIDALRRGARITSYVD
jgi:parvulin-like peptidyl-prolyl isomerase